MAGEKESKRQPKRYRVLQEDDSVSGIWWEAAISLRLDKILIRECCDLSGMQYNTSYTPLRKREMV